MPPDHGGSRQVSQPAAAANVGLAIDGWAAGPYRARPMTSLPPLFAETPADQAEVDALIARAFGPGRLAKSAERLREGNRPLLDLSAVARRDGRVVGCSRMWPIRAAGQPAVLLGPFAVDVDHRAAGLGAAMIAWCCERAAAAGHGLVLLVGDASYFVRLGFEPAPKLILPGPVDRHRVLIRRMTEGADADLSGPVTL